MSPNSQQATIETSVEGIRDAVVKAGFRPGRKVRVQVEYVDAKEVREAELARLTAILDQYPLPPEFQGLSEEEAMALADEAIAEVRAERRNRSK
ncbi:hypothetical protein MTBLM5_110068 [Magnetospirillum sp. LM-5]|uniref:hypothetical protein n=1 Tax=Magnetospirillum sp. LM-5 TaxID=2681466 RepID=UPI00137C81C7|nr:hypothetical protein [Magnetospirillum sp. LM-5]CAA7613314.1 hypothetical protein MTBLM5_110068 [Magnetospirillum sp. LM-5]